MVQCLPHLIGRHGFAQYALGLRPLARHREHDGVIMLHLHRRPGLQRPWPQQLDGGGALAAHGHRQRHVDLRGGEIGVDRQHLTVGGLRLGVLALQIAGDAEIVQRRLVARIAFQDLLEQDFRRRRIGGELDAAEAGVGAQRGGVLRQDRLEDRRGLVVLAQKRQRIALDLPRGHVVGPFAQDGIADLQRHLARAALQGRLRDAEAGSSGAQARPRGGHAPASIHRQQDGEGGDAYRRLDHDCFHHKLRAPRTCLGSGSDDAPGP